MFRRFGFAVGLTIACRGLAATTSCAAEFVDCDAGGRVVKFEAAPTSPDAVSPGDLYVEPSTLHSLGFEWLVAGDENRNARVAVKYRPVADEQWREGMDLLRIKGERVDPGEGEFVCPNMFAGSILFLQPGVRYEVVLRLTDPDGGEFERTLRVPTKSEPVAAEGGAAPPRLSRDVLRRSSFAEL